LIGCFDDEASRTRAVARAVMASKVDLIRRHRLSGNVCTPIFLWESGVRLPGTYAEWLTPMYARKLLLSALGRRS
jgi:hypothetical protein